MHPNFADWYRPASFGHSTETFELRWKGVEEAKNQFDDQIAMELIRLVYGRPLDSAESENIFRKYFKDVDQSFVTTGNGLEMKILAASVLAMEFEDPTSPLTPLAILTASACGLRKLAVEIDLIRMAAASLYKEGILARTRTEVQKLKVVGKAEYDEVILPFTQAHGFPQAAAALSGVTAVTISHLNTLRKAIGKQQALLEIQDEELQMLWWLVGERSNKWDSAFTTMNAKSRPILLAAEASLMTTGFSEPPSLKAVFSRTGVNDSDKYTIPECINACKLAELQALIPGGTVICPTIFPVHFGMSRALETGLNATWAAPWASVTGISARAKVSAVEMAIQVHRECQLLAYLGSK